MEAYFNHKSLVARWNIQSQRFVEKPATWDEKATTMPKVKQLKFDVFHEIVHHMAHRLVRTDLRDVLTKG